MKTLTCLLMIGSMATVFGQSKFALSVQLAPIYSHASYKIELPGGDPTTQLPSTDFRSVSNGLNYSLGIAARYAFSPKWSVGVGVWATHQAAAKNDYWENGFPSTTHYRYNHPLTNQYKIPLLINYQSSTKRLSPYFSAGATFDLRETTYIDINGNGNLIPLKSGKAVVITPLLGVGVLYGLTEHMSLVVQPTIQYSIEPRPTYTYNRYYQVSLQTQLMYRF